MNKIKKDCIFYNCKDYVIYRPGLEVDKWNGEVPIVAGNDSKMIMDMTGFINEK